MDFTKVKGLFTASKNKKKALIIISSFIVTAGLTGLFIYQGTKKSVSLVTDGKEREIRTHAKTVEELLEQENINYKKQDYVFPKVNTELKNEMEVVWKPAALITLTIDGEEKKVWTTTNTVKEFLKENQVEVSKYDQLNISKNRKVKQGLKINLEKAFQIVVNDGGKTSTVWSTSTTVVDFLEQQGIKLNKLDRVEPELDKMINGKSNVTVTRVEKVTDVVEEPINFATITKKDNTLKSGNQQVVQEGKNGKIEKTYEVILENGEEVSKKLVSEKVIKEATDKVVAVGTKTETTQVVSRGSETGKEFYVRSTAYTSSCNGCSGKTATGFDLRANPNAKVIAVDPNVIPLGTKVYVEGYGYAVAADTGGRIKGHKIDVFFASKSDAYRWGNKKVKVKVLK